MAPRPAPSAPGQRGHRRGHGQPHPGWLIGHSELCGVRPHSRAGREPVHNQPAGMGSRRIQPGRRHPVEAAVVRLRPLRHRHPVIRGIDRRRPRRYHRLGPDGPQRDRLHRRRSAAPQDLRRPGAGDTVLDREPGPHPGTGQQRSSRHVRGGGGDLRDPGGAARLRPVGRRAGRRPDRLRLRDKDLCGADRDRAGVATAPAARVDAYGPDRGRVTGDARPGIQPLWARCAETALQRAEAGHAAIAMAPVRAGRAGGRRERDRPGHDHQLSVADRVVRGRVVHLPADLLRSAAGSRGAVRSHLRLDPRRPLGIRVVHSGGVGRADPGSAQPDDPVAGDCHGLPRPLPIQRRAGRPVTTMRSAGQASRARQASPASPATQDPPAQTARWPAAMAAVLRRHWLAAALLAAGLVLRVLTQVAYRPALFYIDTTRYLYDAQGMDPVGYKGPLRAILLVANFDAVAAVQHLLGLAMAVVIYLLLLRRGVPRWLAALAIAPVLLDAYQLQTEQMVMPGVWFQALIVAGLAILLWQPRVSWPRAVAAGVVLGTSATFAQVGEVLILPAVVYLFVAGGGWRRTVGQAAALCAAFALPILAYCTGSYVLTGDFFLSHSGVTSFYGRMAAAADCATSSCRPPSGPCARTRPSRPWDPTGSSTPTAPPSGP